MDIHLKVSQNLGGVTRNFLTKQYEHKNTKCRCKLTVMLDISWMITFWKVSNFPKGCK